MEKVIYRIHDIGEVCGGGTPLTKVAEYWNGDIPWISPDDLTDYKSVYISNGKSFITKLGLQKSSTKVLPKGTILFSSRAPIGYVAIAKNDICTNQGFKSLIPNERINNLYFYYWIKCNLDYIKLFGSGATFPEISGSRMKKIKVEIFKDVSYQEKVATILNNYDQLIENNNRRIQLLENMAESLYKEWFVRFRFPGCEKVEFLDGIPTNFDIVKLGDILTLYRGKGYSSKDIGEGDMTLLSMNNVRPFGGFIRDFSRLYCGDFKETHVLNDGDLIMCITDMTQERRVIGYVGLVTPYEKKMIACTHLIKLMSEKYDNLFLYSMFTYSNLSREISMRSTGTNVLGLTADIIKKVKTLIPPKEIVDAYVEKVRPIFELMKDLEISNEILVQQRDALLPRLMSGKLSVEGKEVI